MRGFQLTVAIALWLAPASSAPTPALNYELDILHGFDVSHGQDYVLNEEVDDEVNNPGEPYVGSLPLECIAKCVADASCHGFVTNEHVCFFRGDSRSTAELVASKTTCSTCTLYLISRYAVFAQATIKALCLLAVGVIIGTAISLFLRSRKAQSKARGEEGDGLVNGQEKSDGGINETGAILNNAQFKAGMPADGLIDKIGAKFREKSGSVGVNGAPSTIFQGNQKASIPFQQKQPAPVKTKQATQAEPPKPEPAAPKSSRSASSFARSNSTQSKAGTPVDSLVDKIGAKFRGSGGNVGANGAPSTGIMGSAFPKDRKASQEITGVREVQRTANMHELASGAARLVDKPYTAVSKAGTSLKNVTDKAGTSLKNVTDRVTDAPMDGSRR